ncbi:MAG: translation initiation factor IF-2 [Candidatus Jacksonbacteria bacterium]|jgi:translation initiation factor IF-2|nr:translation initiation factor IF-2 [Candidatus Jacksonbacteria bacterium]MBT6034729.1 translation initiation factor IF-2 [Candidatus Jacksonbacteria bacterium]MBT6300811.1 translation initiation factor IF-2 [Candidatus Jacksonbacteria bacterium]MBT6757360.1 translation initiation factor IF-2 [Candidatus Jacksonbacteria bacterium]MBT6955551.1 translation initiation factor IF-2 [Candidatus Jacksonbacteria bacterium]
MNITELARQLNVSPEVLREKLPELGFDIGKRAIKIDNVLAQRVKAAWQGMEAEEARKRKAAERKAENQVTDEKEEIAVEDKKVISIPDTLTVNEFAERLSMPVAKVMTLLMQNGIMATLNERIDYETAAILAEDLDYVVERDVTEAEIGAEDKKRAKLEKVLGTQKKENLADRPPVVVVMGHVDHGKTKLLDAIRKTNVVDGESGGITQHIGAYQVEKNGRKMTFIDTPGHEAFSMMRVRGGQVADVAILVVAADDGIMPQTLESLNVIQKEEIPFVIAINKIDKPDADIDRIKQQLSELNLAPEDWGGKAVTAEISAKENIGIDELLETVLLVVDLEELKADPNADACGTVVEAKVDKGEGPIATVIVHAGTLKVGDNVVVGDAYGRIKSLIDFNGERIQKAGPSMPVKIIGLKTPAAVGDLCERVESLKNAKKKKNYHIQMEEKPAVVVAAESSDDESDVKEFPIILRVDVLGSLEAVVSSLAKLVHPEVRVKVVRQGLGDFTEGDIKQAVDLGAALVGFNVTLSAAAKEASSRFEEKIEPHNFTIIYELVDYVKDELEKMLDPEVSEKIVSKAQVIALFKQTGKENIIGGRVEEGTLKKGSRVRVMRKGEEVADAMLAELQSAKQPIDSIKSGSEFGAKVVSDVELAENDVLVAFEVEKKKRTFNS